MTPQIPQDLADAFVRCLHAATSHGHKTSQPKAPRSSGITLTESARKLGVTREHLSRVLHGHRISASLRRRYEALTTHAR